MPAPLSLFPTEDIVVKTEKSPTADKSETKKTKTRSPNYPAIGLQAAINKTRMLWDDHQHHAVPLQAAAETFNQSLKSSSFMQAVGALAQFGLVDDQGRGTSRKLSVSKRAQDIFLHPESSERHSHALAEAALLPAVHRELWDRYEHQLPTSDGVIRAYLISDREDGVFNKSVVDAFIEQFRGSLAFAGVQPGWGGDQAESESEDAAPVEPIKVGALVQWTSQGADRFQVPRKVQGVSDDGAFAFVEGAGTGIPVEQLTVTAAPPEPVVVAPSPSPVAPPANPFSAAGAMTSPAGETVRDSLNVDGGTVVLERPRKLTAEDLEDVEQWLELLISLAKRKADRRGPSLETDTEEPAIHSVKAR